jgi:succinate dehydrogenase / fumarate reductase cytochrome b subunit
MKPAIPMRSRPVSPHLQIYRPSITMLMSILHRMKGAALYAGTLLLAWWLVALASGAGPYAAFQAFAASLFGKTILLGYTWALIHHALGGLRHLLWDAGRGLDAHSATTMAYATVCGSLLLTAGVWLGVGVLGL